MKLSLLLLLCLLFFICQADLSADSKDDIVDQQGELQKIETDINSTQKRLDSLRQLEGSLNSKLLESEQKIQTDKKVLRRLNSELKSIKQEINSTEDSLGNRQLQLELTKRRFLGNLRQFYLTTHRPTVFFSYDPNEELRLNRQKNYLAALAEYESGNVSLAQQYLENTRVQIKELETAQKDVDKLKRKKETSVSLESTKKKKREKDLEKVQRKKEEYADRLLTLRNMAEEISSIIERLQEEAAARIAQQEIDGNESFFPTLKGKLLSPFNGKIIESFGHFVDKRNIKRFSSGISIKGRPGGKVSAVASGTVAYVGNLRGYGNFVIINHDDKYYTTYAGLSNTFVSKNEYVLAGNKLAEADSDGIVKFELREGRKPLDPIEWIRFGSF